MNMKKPTRLKTDDLMRVKQWVADNYERFPSHSMNVIAKTAAKELGFRVTASSVRTGYRFLDLPAPLGKLGIGRKPKSEAPVTAVNEPTKRAVVFKNWKPVSQQWKLSTKLYIKSYSRNPATNSSEKQNSPC